MPNEQKNSKMGVGIALGVAIGAGIGAAIDAGGKIRRESGK